jgi:hypothetical protein
MLIESDFYSTAAGREHFANQIQSIRYCVQETVSAKDMPVQTWPNSYTVLHAYAV